jgi:hypothetical protein
MTNQCRQDAVTRLAAPVGQIRPQNGRGANDRSRIQQFGPASLAGILGSSPLRADYSRYFPWSQALRAQVRSRHGVGDEPSRSVLLIAVRPHLDHAAISQTDAPDRRRVCSGRRGMCGPAYHEDEAVITRQDLLKMEAEVRPSRSHPLNLLGNIAGSVQLGVGVVQPIWIDEIGQSRRHAGVPHVEVLSDDGLDVAERHDATIAGAASQRVEFPTRGRPSTVTVRVPKAVERTTRWAGMSWQIEPARPRS